MMKKILALLLLAAVLFVGFKGYNYYNDRYNGSPYYVQVLDAPKEERQKSDDGQDMGMGYIYNFTAKDPKGQPRNLEVVEYRKPLPENAWIKITASKKIVNNVEIVAAADVPTLAK
ncbi:YxeA family protein [Weissella ceti]|uniref:YxeA family protein n=1 Tax=Weissella ceti TaxID=759620 RepID=A0ABT3E670_9LACO|nr:YxeA family protein [Weissella ceti]MCW0953747.1 YxeA family protein [Weissella ceti]QVK11420.1 YxeA family protein [Weissella ceti]